MAKINVLDSSIFNLISAGEVVEKPMSVVKELVENYIDAGATKIDIEIKNGGIDYIKVSDNGCGIEKSEIHKAFLPHATSKIASVGDLNTILTLGFRGEALASIAAVSKVTLVSKTEEEELGYSITYDSGEIVSEHECGAKKGTTVTVEGLFDKIPARQKYLRSASSEEADIANLITRLILAKPTIAFKLTTPTKTILSTGENSKSALISVYGNDVLSKMEEVSLVMPDITIRGFISKLSFSKHSRNYQTLVVNGRYVKNDEIFYMIYLCYKDFLMTRQYPAFVLYIDLPADMVDVNVHPSKMEVKFVQLDRIKKLIKQMVTSTLNKIALAPKTLADDTAEPPVNKVHELRVDSPISSTRKDFSDWRESPLKAPTAFVREGVPASSVMYPSGFHAYEDRYPQYPKNPPKPLDMPIPPIKSTMREGRMRPSIANAGKIAASFREVGGFFGGDEELLTVGTLFNTYILVEKGDKCYIIDQHAAHERILYEKFVKEIDSSMSIQNLLIPYAIELTHDESAILDQNLNIFATCGFEIKKNGDCRYSITAVPSVISDIGLSEFLPTFFDAIRMNEVKQSQLIKDIIAQSACKAAVKGDRILSQGEICYLIKGMGQIDALLCPHGRPIVIEITKTEVEKWFKRK